MGWLRLVGIGLPGLLLLGCGGPSDGSGDAASGGASAGGAKSAGGGSSARGGTAAYGGSAGESGNSADSGASSSGGSAASGGSDANGGSTGSGGSENGGSANGGVAMSGGASSNGGSIANGGTTSSGGGSANGGISSSGGGSANGGISSSGGGSANGGTTSGGGGSANGGTVSGGTTASGGTGGTAGLPTAPTNFKVALDYGQASLSWNDPTDSGGHAITGFHVTFTHQGVDSGLSLSSSTYGTTLTPLEDGDAYVFAVAAVNSVGEGPAASVNRTLPCGDLFAPGWPAVGKSSTSNNQQFSNVFARDFDKDGKVDVIAVGNNEAAIALFPGRGNGRFARATVSPLDARAFLGMVGDFNGDTWLDVVADSQGQEMVYLGAPGGTFTGVSTLPGPLTAAPLGMANADLDNDGKLDAVFVTPTNYTVMLGAGNGTFPRRADVVTPNFALRTVALAKLNNDAFPDLILGGSASSPSITSEVAVLLGNGDGTFQPMVRYPAASSFIRTSTREGRGQVVAADVNHDNKQDVVVVGESAVIATFLGVGDGTLQAAKLSSTLFYSQALALSDVNNDGNLDAVVGSDGYAGDQVQPDPDGIQVLLGDGAGNFTAQPTLVPMARVLDYRIDVGDLDSDGKADIIATNSNRGFFAFKGHGDGTFDGPAQQRFAYRGQHIATVAVNGPGQVPAIVALGNQNPAGNTSVNTVVTFPVTSAGVMQSPIVSSVATSANSHAPWESFAAGDLNGDTLPDLVAIEGSPAGGSGGAVDLLINNGASGFTTGARYTVAQPAAAVTLCDANQDGKLDAVVNVGPGTIQVFPSTGNGTLGLSYSAMSDSAPGANILCGDVNGDGKVDLVNAPNSGSIGLWIALGNGDYTFKTPVFISGSAAAGMPLLVDVNADGALDVVGETPSGVVTYLGNGAGSFANPLVSSHWGFADPVGNRRSLALGDVDADGKLDAIIGGQPGVAAVMFGQGDGTFAYQLMFPTGGISGLVTVTSADFNGDGRADIAGIAQESELGYVDLLLNKHAPTCY